SVTGNVGIGTDTPASRLSVEQTIAGTAGSAQALVDFNLTVSPSGAQSAGAERDALIAWTTVPGGNTQMVREIRGLNAGAENYGTGSIEDIWGFNGWAYNAGDATVER